MLVMMLMPSAGNDSILLVMIMISIAGNDSGTDIELREGIGDNNGCGNDGGEMGARCMRPCRYGGCLNGNDDVGGVVASGDLVPKKFEVADLLSQGKPEWASKVRPCQCRRLPNCDSAVATA